MYNQVNIQPCFSAAYAPDNNVVVQVLLLLYHPEFNTSVVLASLAHPQPQHAFHRCSAQLGQSVGGHNLYQLVLLLCTNCITELQVAQHK